LQMKLLAVLKTGEGKTHIIQCWGVFTKGICLVLHPILALTADQVLKFTKESDKHGTIEAHNMDDASSTLLQKVIAKMKQLKPSTMSTMFLFCSPWFLANPTPFLNEILRAAIGGTLQNVIADKAHLFAIRI